MALIERLFTSEHFPNFGPMTLTPHDVLIQDHTGKTVFEQKGVLFPDFWSEQSVQVVASKYFSGHGEDRERSLFDLIDRVVGTIGKAGRYEGYFDSDIDQQVFEDELTYLILHQYVTFNSPTWFNIGVPGRKQIASACFLIEVEDSIQGILDWYTTEGLIFSGGSGSGVNISTLRSAGEKISNGGVSSGPLSFMKAADVSSGTIKSGGAVRRAAKLVSMNVDHPDILDFIRCKVVEEHKARALVEAGFDGSFGGEVSESLAYQNANHSVRVSDAFMEAVGMDTKWETRNVVDKQVRDSYSAKELFHEIAKAAWACGCPGVQFNDTINEWHTCPKDGTQSTSNPCSEYLFLVWTSCNLATLNLLKFRNEETCLFQRDKFQQAVRVLTVAQDILISYAESPIPKISEETKKYRTIGLNYANLGAYLMHEGTPYDSPMGRYRASTMTSLMTAFAYDASADIAQKLGPFARYEANKEDLIRVLKKHRLAAERMANTTIDAWDTAIAKCELHGVRNAQTSLAAPTGTVSFMLGCDTTGIEPPIALVAEKSLAGGGTMRLSNQQVRPALKSLGYSQALQDEMLSTLETDGVDEFLKLVKQDHLDVFDCALPHGSPERFISPIGHVDMVAAIQPFISMGQSKTVNMPNSSTVEDIANLYMYAWKKGLKSVTVYRDGCKQFQPLKKVTRTGISTTSTHASVITDTNYTFQPSLIPNRKKLPDDRHALTHKFSVGGLEGYITVGLYPDGTPGEVFMTVSKQGSTLSGMMDSFATLLSISLQYGVPLTDLIRKFSYMRFEPMGYTNNPDLKISTSLIDYLFRWLELKFVNQSPQIPPSLSTLTPQPVQTPQPVYDSPLCTSCGGATIRSGSCHTCTVCFSTTGCS